MAERGGRYPSGAEPHPKQRHLTQRRKVRKGMHAKKTPAMSQCQPYFHSIRKDKAAKKIFARRKASGRWQYNVSPIGFHSNPTAAMTSPTSQQLAHALSTSLKGSASLDAPLDELLKATGARATGLWHVVGEELHQVGFRGVAEMPDEVKRDFAAATARVPLDRTGLGIVRAIVDRTPFLVKRQPGSRDLMTSPGWLERFECESSLAIPVFHDDRPVGALAVSHSALIERDGPLWTMLVETARQLSEALKQRQPTSSTGA